MDTNRPFDPEVDGSPERFRGSSELPITGQGLQAAHALGMQLASKGGLDELMASSLGRTVQTAKIISHYTHAPITYIGDGLHPWHLGQMEGQEVTPAHHELLAHLTTENPDESLPMQGRGPLSTADGESFNDFKARTLPMLQKVISRIQSNPQLRLGVVTHYRVKKLIEAWIKRGLDPQGTIDNAEMVRHDGSGGGPGGVDRLSVDSGLGPQLHAVDLHSPGQLPGGAYLIRHERTPWNSPQTPQTVEGS